ncbi:hypothetical protein NOGI109294_07150 [Nocardiopsis gilva]|uniref:hypothetical protein n=1 Tax=Nocardiopsis gilva TaxID=280236 RepID=UPI00034CDD8F|nr:hypothetical protein [Nocardiopsis gilva]
MGDPENVPIDRVLYDRAPCINCFPDYAGPGAKLCWVLQSGVWHKGLLKRWRGRNSVGLWEADVVYAADHTQRTLVLDERFLRPRDPNEQTST